MAYHMELMQNNICNKLSFHFFYRFFNMYLMICLKIVEQNYIGSENFCPLMLW